MRAIEKYDCPLRLAVTHCDAGWVYADNFKKSKITKPSFWDYLTHDEDGFVNGIREDAPEKEKEAYKKYLERKEIKRQKGIK